MISAQQLSSRPTHLALETGLLKDTVANPPKLLQFVPITREVLKPVRIYIFLGARHAHGGQLRLPLLRMRMRKDLGSWAVAGPVPSAFEFVVAA